MATLKLFLREMAADIDPTAELDKFIKVERGGTSVSAKTRPTATGASNPQVTKTAGGTNVRWYSLPLDAATISGTVTFNIWGIRYFQGTGIQDALDNFTVKVSAVLTRTNGAGTGIETIASGQALTNFNSSPSARQFTGAVAAPVTLTAGDRLLLVLSANFVDVAFTTTDSFSTYYDGPTDAAQGDSWVSMTTSVVVDEGSPDPGDSGNTTEEGTVTECP